MTVATARPPIQEALLAAIRMFVNSNGYSPSVRELAAAVGKSIYATHQHLYRLRDEGALQWKPNVARSIRLVEK
jgi:repressor LexA